MTSCQASTVMASTVRLSTSAALASSLAVCDRCTVLVLLGFVVGCEFECGHGAVGAGGGAWPVAWSGFAEPGHEGGVPVDGGSAVGACVLSEHVGLVLEVEVVL